MAKKGGESMTIEDRLENMERELGRQKRRNRWLLAAILPLVGGLVASGVFKTMITPVQAQGAGTAKEIRARSLVIEDENGNGRAELCVDQNGSRLRLCDEKGFARAALGVTNKDGPILALFDQNGKLCVGLSAFSDGPELTMYDEKGERRALLLLQKYGARLMLVDEKGYTRAALGVANNGGPILTLNGEDGKGHVSLDVNKNSPCLSLWDENEKARAMMEVNKDGPELTMYDEKGIMRFVAGKVTLESPEGKTTGYPESSLILFGPDGKSIWSAIK